MSIFPLTNHNVVNYDVLISSSFKSGMILAKDSNGYAIKADRSSLSLDSSTEQFSKFIGFASGDHDVNNKIILSDPVGSNYLDSNNFFVDNVNSHYGLNKRSIAEFSDENVSRYYNIFDNSLFPKRGVGIYNLENEIYITDQYNNVLAYTTFADETTATTLYPGDLLTIGAGVNAGKLVKVDISGNGPNVVIVGIVEKYDAAANLLYFRHQISLYQNTPSLFSTGLVMNLDANNTLSYDPNVGGTTWYDLSGNNNDALLRNGVTWNSGGYFVLDNSDDNIEILDANTLDFAGDFTVECLYKAYGNDLHMIIGKRNPSAGGIGVWAFASFFGLYGVKTAFWSAVGGGGAGLDSGTTYVTENVWYHFTITRISNVKYLYINGVLVNSGADSYDYTNPYSVFIGRWDGNVVSNPGHVIAARMYQNVGLTSDQVRQNFHSIIGRIL